MDSKRPRAKNFDETESQLLLDLVDNERHILLCKETNKINNDQKQQCWNRITTSFNATSKRNIKRSKDALSGLWKKLKQDAKSNKAQQKV